MTKSYKLVANCTAILRDDGAFIPADPANRDFAEYEAWLAEGNAPDPADPIPELPPPPPDPAALLARIVVLEAAVASLQAQAPPA